MTTPVQPARTGLDLDEDATAIDWIQANAKKLGLAGIAVAAIAVVTFLVRSSNESKEAAAARELASAQQAVASENMAVAVAELTQVTQRYGSTAAGTQARLLLAQVQLREGKVDEAMAALDAISSAGALQASVHALRGAALEQSSKPAEAAAEYLKAAATSQLEAEAESFRADAARAYLAANNREEALKIWTAMANNPASVLQSEAQLRVGELGATTVSK